jgi:uncharacterized protein YkwD
LVWSDILQKSAEDHVNDVAPKGIVSCVGSDGSYPVQRIEKYARVDESWGETSIYGAINTMEVVERMIVCDG